MGGAAATSAHLIALRWHEVLFRDHRAARDYPLRIAPVVILAGHLLIRPVDAAPLYVIDAAFADSKLSLPATFGAFRVHLEMQVAGYCHALDNGCSGGQIGGGAALRAHKLQLRPADRAMISRAETAVGVIAWKLVLVGVELVLCILLVQSVECVLLTCAHE